jgi:hypothetical protein
MRRLGAIGLAIVSAAPATRIEAAGDGPGWQGAEPERVIVLDDGTRIRVVEGAAVVFTAPTPEGEDAPSTDEPWGSRSTHFNEQEGSRCER